MSFPLPFLQLHGKLLLTCISFSKGSLDFSLVFNKEFFVLSTFAPAHYEYMFLQLYVGGPTLARGYLNRPELNSVRFVPRPKEVPETVGNRLYRTGDWGYMLSDGNLEICGRCDTMVKIRGYSLEIQVSKIKLCHINPVYL